MKPILPSIADFTRQFKHEYPIRVRFSDMDVMRHVNNTVYFIYLEEARIAYFKEVVHQDLSDLEFGSVVAHAKIDYLCPIVYGEKVTAYTKVSRLGKSSYEISSALVKGEGLQKQIAATAQHVLVCFSQKSGQKTDIPQQIVEKVRAFEEL